MTLSGRRHFRPGENDGMLGAVIAPVVILLLLVVLVAADSDESL